MRRILLMCLYWSVSAWLGVGVGLAQEPSPTLVPEIDLADIRARAEKNDPQAQTTLGTFHQLGQQGLKPDYKEAMKWFQRAAAQGDPGAMYRIGYMHYTAQGVAHNMQEAVRWFRKSAQAGFAVAQYTVGNMFKDGFGVPQNYSEALRWFYYAAEQGYAPAQHQVGALIFQGKGTDQNYIEGCKWWYIAAEQEYPNAKDALTTVALPLMARDEMEHANNLAREFKPQPPRAVPEKAEPPPIFHELLAKANAGDAEAQYQLSLLLQSGQPTIEDLKEARKWVVKAAAGGNAEAQHQLGSMYFTGQGMVKDYVSAYKWMALAAGQGRTNAVAGRDRVAAVMTPFQLAEARKQVAAFTPAKPVSTAGISSAGSTNAPASGGSTFIPSPTPEVAPSAATSETARSTTMLAQQKAASSKSPTVETLPTDVQALRNEAESGKPEAQLALGLKYLHGQGVPADRVSAIQWLEKAAGKGHSPAQYWLATTFDGPQQNERVKWMRRAADGGFGLAQLMVGQMYFTGQGVAQDVIEAYKWLHLASQQGNPAADAFLATVAPVMNASQIEEAKRRAEEVAFRLKNQ